MKIHRCAATARDGEDDEGCGVRTFHWLEFLSSRCRRRWRCSRSRSRPKRLVVTSCCHRQWSLSSSLPWPGVEVCASTKCPYSAFAFPLSMCPNVCMMIEVSMYTQLFVYIQNETSCRCSSGNVAVQNSQAENHHFMESAN